MAAIDRALPLAARPAVEPQIEESVGTMEKIKQFMNRFEGVGTVFSLLAGAVVAVIWGVKLGLLTAAIGGIVTLAISFCHSKSEQPPAPEVGLDPAQQLRPSPRVIVDEDPEVHERHQASIPHLLGFCGKVQRAILLQSLHFDNLANLFSFLRDHFRIDGLRLTLLSAKPIRFNDNKEGYEITIRSEAPQGWIRLYLPKGRELVFENVRNPQPIERVTPFLWRDKVERNHFATFDPFFAPFQDMTDLCLAILADHPIMDLTQIRFVSGRNVRYESLLRPFENVVLEPQAHNGYEISLQTPNGPVRYYINSEDGDVASSNNVQNVIPI